MSTEPDTPAEDERPAVIPSAVDPDIECVRIDEADSPAEEPPGGLTTTGGPKPCPDGYLPRRRRRDYHLDGKRAVTDTPPVRNPADTDD